MSFVSPEFAFAVLLFLPVFWSLKAHKGAQLWVLTIASYLLYSTWSTDAVLFLFGLSLFVWLTGNLINAMPASHRLRGLVMSVSVLFGSSLLLYTKYYDFLRQMAVDTLPHAGLQTLLPVVDVVAPAGVSFFTFQAITCLVWCYRSERQRLPLRNVLVFLSFWPTLFSGPILRAEDFFRQMEAEDFGRPCDVPRAIYLILLGLGQKLVIENWLADTFVDTAFRYPETLDAFGALAAIWGYTLQIFFDFAGYSLIVIGLALLLGYRVPANFQQPYLARNLREFWRCWHISLSSFIRDYVYFPLGGSRVGTLRTCTNIMIAMVVSGLWHGANVTFVVWGALHGFGVLAIHLLDRMGIKKMPRALATTLTLIYVGLAWVFFRASSIDDAWALLQRLTVVPRGLEVQYVWLLFVSAVFFVLSVNAEPLEKWTVGWIRQIWGWRLVFAASVVSYIVIYLGPNGIPAFIYYRF